MPAIDRSDGAPYVPEIAAVGEPAADSAGTERLRAGIEAILFLADEPVPIPVLADVLEADPAEVEAEVSSLAAAYERGRRGLQVRHSAGGWRMYTAPIARDAIEAWAVAGRTGRLTQAALETLAVIAYKQPVSRQQIGDIRGVNADAAVRSLVARGLVAEVGRDPGPGQAVLYGTTTSFLERVGLDSLDDLPPLTEFLEEVPAPDEPELGALREVRRRLAAGEDLPVGGQDRVIDEGDDDALPAPVPTPGSGRADADMDALTDRLEAAARNAVDRLRTAVAAGDGDAGDGDAGDVDAGDGDTGDGDTGDGDTGDVDAREGDRHG